MSNNRLLINITCFPHGKKPVYAVRTLPYTDVTVVSTEVYNMLYDAPLIEYMPEPVSDNVHEVNLQ